MARASENLTSSFAASRRPRDLALLRLAAGTEPPRARARDQQADLAGGALLRVVLDRLAALDPDPDGLDAALASIVAELGEPTGPTRGVCAQVRDEWAQLLAAPSGWDWLLSEAVERSALGDEPRPTRRRRHGPA
jgi:hypothetical protein